MNGITGLKGRNITGIFFKIISLILAVAMLAAVLPAFAADEEKERRVVYLHARGENPQDSQVSTTVFSGDDCDVYLAVDDPNKSGIKDGKYTEPQYNLNGYTVKIYFDPAFLDFRATDKTTAETPIDYTVPSSFQASGDGTGNDNVGSNPDEVVNTPGGMGYYVYKLGSDTESKNGKMYKVAYATIFFSGKFLPQKRTDQFWYNILKLPLKTIKNGSTDVFIEIGTADEYALELFAKDNNNSSPTFNFSAIEGGYHHITIKDKYKPEPPYANPVSGSYTENQEVELKAEDDCDIYYSKDGGVSFELYTKPVFVDQSIKLECYAQRKNDETKKSNTVSFEYKIIPEPPYLFNALQDKPISNVYSENSIYEVYPCDSEIYQNIKDGNEIYYTFSALSRDVLEINLENEEMYSGSDPYKEWVRLDKAYPIVDVEKSLTLRMVTVRANNYSKEFSDVAVYHLGIQPDYVKADPGSGVFGEAVDVTLSCETSGAKIFYTTDNSDPRESGIPYETYLTFNKDTSLRCVAFYEGQWSEVKSYWYIIDVTDEYGVEAFYPPGVYEGSVNVTLTPLNPENTIEYSIDGGEKWLKYTQPLPIEKSTEILARAIDKNGEKGDIYPFSYTIKPAPPVFSPESTQFTNADKITVYCDESRNDPLVQNYERYDLFYTLDGSDPSDSKNAGRKKADDVSDAVVIHISDYTVVKAAVLLDNTTYSTVVTHSYDIVKNKPVAPMTTLPAGHYTVKIGGEGYDTKFVPVPTNTNTYYTIAYGDEIKGDPFTNADETIAYTPGTDIELKGRCLIKAVAVNAFNKRSDIGVFEYIIVPEAPVAAPSAAIGGELPVIPVDAVKNSLVTYTVGDFTNSFENAGGERFYIDLKTGEAYRSYENGVLADRLGDESDTENTSMVTLSLKSKLDGVESLENRYVYTVSANPAVLAAPYADKASGTYQEIDRGNGALLKVALGSLNTGDTIQYMKNNDGNWNDYDGNPVDITEDTVLHIRSVKDGKTSPAERYTYEFVPLAPIITLDSGRYSDTPVPVTQLKLNELAPDKNYTIFYRKNGEQDDVMYRGDDIDIDHTMTLKAYVKNEDTGKKSENAINFYIIEPKSVESGSVYTAYPYEVYTGDTKYISAHLLSTPEYNKGIKLHTQNPDAKIRYWYSYERGDGSGPAATETMTYDNAMPIFVNSSMANLTIVAYLIDKNGNEIENSQSTFNYVFTDLGIPDTSLEDSDKDEFEENTEYILRSFGENENKFIYFTTDGSDPSDKDNKKRVLYKGETLRLTESTTVNAVYYQVCSRCSECRNDDPYDRLGCLNAMYGQVGSYRYTIPKVIYGGGGGSSNNSRKYTKDIFGNEHPTHIGYIKGYPDGSVQPDGFITREEIASVLYRIINHEYEKPFAVSGDVFPDVAKERWSALEIEYMADRNVIVGYPDGEFKPSGKLTRAEFAALIYRFAKIKKVNIKNPFNDLTADHWAYSEILSLVKSGLMQGYEDSSFRPESNITRAEVMTVINKILGRKPLESYVRSLEFNPYNDLDEDKWYYITVLEATITHDYYLNIDGYERMWENWK